MSKNAKKLVPKLRFPEFHDVDEWKEKSLNDVCNMQAGKFVRAADIFGKQNGDLYPCYGGNGQRGFTKSFTHEGKYSLIGRQGALCGNITLANGKFHATEHAVVVSPNNNVNTDWLFYMLGFMNLNQYATGQAQPGLSVENLEKLPIIISTEEKEQQKIADCLSSIDDLISAQSQKVEALKIHKKGLMQQLFPREGETVPRLRFPEFQEAWDKTQLKNLCISISSGRDVVDSEGEFNLYGSTSIIGKTKNPSFNGERLLVARVGANAGLLTKAHGVFGVTDNTLVITLNPNVNINFIYHFLGTININRLIFGSGQPLITGSILKDLSISLPSNLEQEKISACLSEVEHLIELHTFKLETIRKYKTGLMQQLFPSSVEIDA